MLKCLLTGGIIPEELIKKIDATILKIDATCADIAEFLNRAKIVLPRAVVFHGNVFYRAGRDDSVKAAVKRLKEAGVLISPVIDFPLGAGGRFVKFLQWDELLREGADEFDFCLNLGAFLSGRYGEAREELELPARFSKIKVIIHNHYLVGNKQRLEDAIKLVRDAGAFCVKDSTGFEPPVSRQVWQDNKKRFLEISRTVAPELKVKLAGGFKTLADIEIFEELGGADIYGLSAFYKIFLEMKNLLEGE